MDKNTIIGFVLIAAVLIGFSWYNRPTEEELKAQQEQVEKQKAEQQKAAEKKQAEAAKQKAALAQAREDTTALFHDALIGTASDLVLKNEKVELTLSTKGGVVTKAVVKNFKDRKGAADVTLFDGKEQQLNFLLATKEAKAAQREAEAKRDEELRQKGYQCEDIENWMKSRTITADGQKLTLWEWYQRERRDAGDDL